MKSTSRVGALSVALLVVGNITTSIALSVKQLDCTHGFDRMSCDFDAPTCSGYSLTLRCLSSNDLASCIFKQCDRGKCCCSTQMSLIYGENHNATLWKGDENLASKIISVADRFKPRVPTNVTVEESYGNFEVTWWTNMDHRPSVRDDLRAVVTYGIKGDTAQVSEPFKPTTVNGLRYYEINGKHLKPSTTYLVSVRSVYWNNLSSDSSQEVEFTTSMSPDVPRLAIIISLSIAAVIISGVIYGCFAKAKTVWWDSVAKCPNPRLLDMHPRMEEVLKPVRPLLSPISVEPLIPDDSKSWSEGSLHDGSSGSSGISTCSSCTSYTNTEPVDIVASVEEALRKAFPNINLISPLATSPFQEMNPAIDLISSPYNLCDVRADDVNSGSSGFDNKTYSTLIPNLPHPTLLESSEVQMLSDSVYHPSQGDIVICADQQIPACPLITFPPAASSLIPMDMSYQQCSLDSGAFSCAEDSSLSSSSSSTNPIAACDPAFRVENGCERSDEAVGDAAKLNGTHEVAIKCDENPCYGCVPAVSHSFPPVNDDYQAFQNLVGQPDILFAEQRSDEEEEHLDKYPEESISEMPEISLNPAGPGSFDNVQGAKCLPELEKPLTGSSCTSYANTEPVDIVAGVEEALPKAFPNKSPISPLTTSPFQEMNPAIDLISSPYNLCDVRADDVNSGSSGFDSKTYSILIPNLPHPTLLESSDVQMQCDSVYHPSQGDIVICADQQIQACPLITFPPAASSLIPMDMSYQQCSLDSGTFSCAEDSSLSSSSTNPIAACDPAFRVENGCERSDEAVGDAAKLNGTHEVAIKCDENPCYGCVPAVSHSFPPVNDDYQAFQNLVGQPDILFAEQQTDEEEEHLDKYPEESISEMPEISLNPAGPGSFDNVQGAKCLPELEKPLTGSSCTSYANTEPVDIVASVEEALPKAFPNKSPISPLTTSPFQEMNPAIDLISSPYNLCDVRADDVNSGSSGFDSKTYSILIPNLPHLTLLESSEVQMQCDSAYHPSQGDIVICADQQIQACPLITFPPAASSVIPMDMSYQQCSLDSGTFSCAEDSSLSSSSSSANPIATCDPAFRVENGCERSDEAVGDAAKLNGTHEVAIKCDENPCYGCVPAVSHSFPPVNDDYQAFQNLVGQPDILYTEQRSDEEEEHLDKFPEESISEMPEISLNPTVPGLFDNFQGAKCLPELERPLTGSSCTSYANTEPVDIVAGVEALCKAFPNINLISPLATSPFQEMNPAIDLISSPYNLCDVRADDVNSGSSGFDSKTYSILIPNLPHPTLLESSDVQMQCDSAYHPSQGDIVICADQQIPACPLITFPPAASSLIPMDMSYQQCSLDSGTFSCAEDSSLSSSSTNPIAACDPAFRVENGCERSDEAVGDAAKLNGTHEVAIKCDENPCYGCVPAVSHSFPPVNDDYQAFQNLVGQPDILFAEQQTDEEEEHLDKYPEESISEMPEISLNPAGPGSFDNVQGAKCLPELEKPLTGSSCTSYANTEPVDIVASVEEALPKAFPNKSPISPLTTSPFQEMNPAIDLISSPYNLCDVRADDVNSGSSGFDSKTYSILIPNLPHLTLLESSEVQMQCDSAYHPSQGDIVICADQQIQACPLITFPPAASSLIPMDMSYQQCSLDSGTFSCAEDSSLSSSSSSTNPIATCDPAFRVENGCERSDEAVGDAAKLNGTHEVAIKCDENPCYGYVPAVSHSFPPVNDDYQAFQNLVGQPDILYTEQRSDEEEEHLDKYPEESISEMPEISLNPTVPGLFDNFQGAKCLPELERPLTGSSCTSYTNTEPVDIVAGVEEALRKAFPNINLISPVATSPFQEMNPAIDLISSPYNLCDVRADDVNSGSSGFDSKTYSILIPNLPHPTLLESSEVQMQCDSVYHPSQGDIVICADQQIQARPLITFPPAASSLIPMDMSYQQCSLDSGTFSCAEDSSLSSSSSSTNPIAPCVPAFRVENGCERSDEAVGDAAKLNGTHEVAIKCDENPCYGCVPAVSHSFPPVNDDYQAFQNLVGQPDILFAEQRSDEEEEHLDKYPEESISEMPEISLNPAGPGFFDNVQGAKCLPELERPLLSLLSAGQSMPAFTEGGYQSV